MLKLYHIRPTARHPGSHNGVKVCVLLNELGCDYEQVNCDPDRDLRPENAPLRALNPNGLTPIIDDDGFVLWESSAVLQYLAETRGPTPLCPRTGARRALVQQWLGWEASTLTPALMRAFFDTLDALTPPTQKSANLERMKSCVAILDRQLAASGQVVGDYSLADISLGCIASALFLLDLDLAPYTRLLRWLSALAGRPGWQEDVFQNDIATARGKGYAL